MQDERPAISQTVPSATSFIQKSIQRLGEPRVLGWLAVAFVLITWETVVAGARLNPIYLPRPSQILIALTTMFRTGGLLGDLLATLARIFGGFAIALVTGTLLGIWMATSERVSAIADNFIAALYPLPKVTLIPLLIIWPKNYTLLFRHLRPTRRSAATPSTPPSRTPASSEAAASPFRSRRERPRRSPAQPAHSPPPNLRRTPTLGLLISTTLISGISAMVGMG